MKSGRGGVRTFRGLATRAANLRAALEELDVDLSELDYESPLRGHARDGLACLGDLAKGLRDVADDRRKAREAFAISMLAKRRVRGD